MNIYWLEQTEAQVPRGNSWLSDGELLRLDSFRIPKRRAEWRLGRWTAKCAVAAFQELPLHASLLTRMEIRPAATGAPEVFVTGMPTPAAISLSHRAGKAICMVAEPGVKLGCDLELIEPRSQAFVTDYFTSEEQQQIERAPAAERSRLLALLWSGKESALKALQEGLRLDTRCVTVTREDNASDLHGWSRLRVLYTGGYAVRGWWRHADGVLRTVVADPSPAPPIRLQVPAYCPDKMALCA